MQRAYLIGFRRAKARAKVEREQIADEFYEVLDDIHAEPRGVRSEIARRHAINEAAEVVRDPTMWLN